MLCASISGPTPSLAKKQMLQAQSLADIVEIRLDLFEDFSVETVQELIKDYPLPVIFTLRKSSHGGAFKGSEEERRAVFKQLVVLKPQFIDLEVDTPFLEEFLSSHTDIKFIISSHDLQTTANLEDQLQKMQRFPANYYKIAAMAHSSLDAIKMLQFLKNCPKNVIGVSMGEQGSFGRVMTPNFSYANIGDKTAPGQLSAKTLIDEYRFKEIDANTQYYALLGSPLTSSISYKIHNDLFKQFNINARYLKIELEPHELITFLSSIKDLPFAGFSVTAPLKEHILPLLDEIDPIAQRMGAVNTVLIKSNKLIGFNTDGFGALDALEKKGSVKGKKLVLLGAGGAARAIAYEAIQRGANVCIVNRTREKAEKLARELGCEFRSWNEWPKVMFDGYDIIVNATSVLDPLQSQPLLSHTIAMDCAPRPIHTPFLEAAKGKGCSLVYGYEMWAAQAPGQYKIWLPKHYLEHCNAIHAELIKLASWYFNTEETPQRK